VLHLLTLKGRRFATHPPIHAPIHRRVTADAVDRIKRCPLLLPLLKTLKEVNLEFFTVDPRTVVTDHPNALIRWVGVGALMFWWGWGRGGSGVQCWGGRGNGLVGLVLGEGGSGCNVCGAGVGRGWGSTGCRDGTALRR